MGAMTNARHDAAGSGVAHDPDRIAVRPSGAAPRFHETWEQFLRRMVLGVGYAVRLKRIALLPRLWLMTIVYYLTPKARRGTLPVLPRFYSPRGLIGISDDLSVPALIDNYARGYFPVCHIGPMKWWCPEECTVMDPADTHVSRHVRRLLRQNKYTVTMDKAFGSVMEACARPRGGKVPLTWITPQIMRAYWQAYKAGYAHSVEVWDDDGTLVAGAYGLAIGKVYFGESQFCTVRDTSKLAITVLHRHLTAWGFKLCAAKWMASHLASCGFHPMAREDFMSLLQWYVEDSTSLGRWEVDSSLDYTNWKEAPCAPGSALESAPIKVA